jgi:hypothetical protein
MCTEGRNSHNLRGRLLFGSLLVLLLIFLAGCGGGGGGDDEFIGAAIVNISASPKTIDTGDRIQVRIRIEEVHETGIALKVRYPEGLLFVNDSTKIETSDEEREVAPTTHVTDDNETYLVYYLDPDDLGENNRGELTFELEGVDSVNDGKIEVDPDVNDPDIPDASEFNVDSPEFSADADVKVTVEDM